MRIGAFGDAAVLVELDQRIDTEILGRARAIADAWERSEGAGEAVPAYASVLLRFDPLVLDPDVAPARARLIAEAQGAFATPPGRLIEVPTRYDGPDLVAVATLSGITPERLVALHAGREYTAFFLGFMPGFAYCGMLDPGIVAPRLETPRVRVPAGSVAIADGQTAVYPFDSPGGWRLIGHTEVRPFDAAADPPALIVAGDRVRFVPL